MPPAFRYNVEKTAQAVGFLLRQPGRDHCAYMKVLKLLYVAERESFLETGAPITGDTLVSMDKGPVLSATYNLMQSPSNHAFWARCFRPRGDHELAIASDPGTDLLCPYEIDKLSQVAVRFADKDRWDASRDTHNLPEWEDPQGSSKIILLKTILETKNKGGRTGRILREERARQAFLDAVRG